MSPENKPKNDVPMIGKISAVRLSTLQSISVNTGKIVTNPKLVSVKPKFISVNKSDLVIPRSIPADITHCKILPAADVERLKSLKRGMPVVQLKNIKNVKMLTQDKSFIAAPTRMRKLVKIAPGKTADTETDITAGEPAVAKKTKCGANERSVNSECAELIEKLRQNFIPKIGHAATSLIMLRFCALRNSAKKKNLLLELDQYMRNLDALRAMKTNEQKTVDLDVQTYEAATQTYVMVEPRDAAIQADMKVSPCDAAIQVEIIDNAKHDNKLGMGFQNLLNYIENDSSDNMSGISCNEIPNHLLSFDILDQTNNSIPFSPISAEKMHGAGAKSIDEGKKINKMQPHDNIYIEISKLQMYKEWKNCNVPDEFGNMPIHIMVSENDKSLVKRQCLLLKSRNLSVDIRNVVSGVSSLHTAITNNSKPEIVSILLENGADPETQDNEGSTCIHYAIKHDNCKAIEMMMGSSVRKPNMNLYNFDGYTPLIYATLLNKPDIVTLLIKHGADIDARDKKSGRTALFHSIINSYVDLFLLLLSNKADIKIKNLAGLTVWDAVHELSDVDSRITHTLAMHENSPAYLKYSLIKKNKAASTSKSSPLSKRKGKAAESTRKKVLKSS